ncbi:hypothetical protein psyc5s11_40760 [Clostridium gelidum]|uniref:Putative amidase domain-containing protein n=1 Tax=Clostridium gelidum TaxID=704125 RepID=A0ABN6J0Y5_9CLOT|nr:amidase domain-containing protein [Clostridium gelidum]BCZ48009.1 hypothetical protein psyc5s11_40760 [Clostridium gelidum]
MLSKSLYNLCALLSTPYDNLNSSSNNIYDLDNSLLQEIYLKKLFDFEWSKKLNSIFKNFQFDYNYNIIDQNFKFIKLKLNFKASFIIQNYPNNIPSACLHEYIVILEHLQGKYQIQFLLEKEEKPALYYYVLETDLSNIDNSIFYKSRISEENNISLIDSLYETFMTSNFFSNSNHAERKVSNFNIEEACNYAERFALNYNPNYKSFAGIGGDCTNFMSQILHAGGFKQTPTWKPYTHVWIRVQEFYAYLTTHKLGTNLPDDKSLDKGCLIQFYTPAIGRFFHNGFITYKLQNNDCLYCCHSYDKLNYPLSQIYPHRYPKIRALTFN